MPIHRSIDIDDDFDLFIVEQVLEGKWSNWMQNNQT